MSTTEKGKQEIDFVITWVDGSDDRWQKEKQETRKHLGIVADVDDRKERYRDWDNLQYWFRGVEKYAPWVRKIHFVTWGHLPKWLNTDHPKLRVVNHEDFIPRSIGRPLIRIQSNGICIGFRIWQNSLSILTMICF